MIDSCLGIIIECHNIVCDMFREIISCSSSFRRNTMLPKRMFLKYNKKNEKGFTLIELIIVIAIVGILATIAIQIFSHFRSTSNDITAKADLKNACTAQEAYYMDYDIYADNLADLQVDPYSFGTSKNVTITVAGDADSYTMTSFHINGNKTWTVTGPGGTISE